MDVAYDHVQEASYPDDDKKAKEGDTTTGESAQTNDLKTDLQQAYQAVSNSPWAARFGGWMSSAKKQGEQYLEQAQKDSAPLREQATSGFASIVGRARGLSILQAGPLSPTAASSSDTTDGSKDKEKAKDDEVNPAQPESLPADIIKEARGMFTQFQSLATERLKGIDMKKIEAAEDAADEALLKWGTNVRNFLRDAVTIAPPEESVDGNKSDKVLFESKDAEGKRVIHTTRFDAQLHVIHSSLDSFLKDPVSPQWEPFVKKFDMKAQKESITKDLEKYEDLRKAVEKLVPERVEPTQFWARYYFLRHVIESEERRRKEMLQASASNAAKTEKVDWGEDSDDSSEEEESEEDDDDDDDDDSDDSDEDSDDDTPQRTPKLAASKETLKAPTKQPATTKAAVAKAAATKPPAGKPPATKTTPTKTTPTKPTKATEPRRSGDQQSQADSDASYDLVSGANSRAKNSPKDPKKAPVAEESDEDDWE